MKIPSIIFAIILMINPMSGRLYAAESLDFEQINGLSIKLDEYFSTLADLGQFNGSILFYSGEREIVRKAYNMSPEQSSLFVSTESQFGIQSVAKLMAYALVLDLENEGKLKRTDSIQKFYPNFPKDKIFTIQHLLDHSSGLPREFSIPEDSKNDITSSDMPIFAAREVLEFEPGTNRMYSNIGYQLIFSVIALIEGESFEQALHKNLLAKLQMNATGGYSNWEIQNLDYPASPHRVQNGIAEEISFVHLRSSDSRQGQIYSTLDDLRAFMDHIRNEPYKSVLQDSRGVIQKNGGNLGGRSQVYVDSNLGFGFIILSNVDSWEMGQVVQDSVSIMEGKPYNIPTVITRIAMDVDSSILESFTGVFDFVSLNHLLFEIVIIDGFLHLVEANGDIIKFLAESENTFFDAAEPSQLLEFQKDKDEVRAILHIDGFSIPAERID